MKQLSITKAFNFCYGHFLPKYLGKCSNIHGHNAILEVEVEGVDESTLAYPGMIIDFGKLKNIVNTVLENYDHKFLNEDTHPFRVLPPTAENIIKELASDLTRELPKGVALRELRLTETPTSWVTWRAQCT